MKGFSALLVRAMYPSVRLKNCMTGSNHSYKDINLSQIYLLLQDLYFLELNMKKTEY